MREIVAVFVKEWRTELRARAGLFTIGLFGFTAVATLGYAAFNAELTATVGAGLICALLLFAATLAMPRPFLSEDDQGTFDLLRLIADPTKAFLGKTLFNLSVLVGLGIPLALALTAMLGLGIERPLLFLLAVGLECVGLSATVSLCGALAMGASNRWLLATAIAMPLVLPQTALAVGALRVALGEGVEAGGWQGLMGLAGFSLAALGMGPPLAAANWRTT